MAKRIDHSEQGLAQAPSASTLAGKASQSHALKQACSVRLRQQRAACVSSLHSKKTDSESKPGLELFMVTKSSPETETTGSDGSDSVVSASTTTLPASASADRTQGHHVPQAVGLIGKRGAGGQNKAHE